MIMGNKKEEEYPDIFYHVKELEYLAKPECPDPLIAKQLQEISC